MDIPGYAGRILHVDLTDNKTEEEALSSEVVTDYIGGSGINSKLAYDLIPPDGDPLSPENPLILGAGPFTGTIIPGASKLAATLKFPLNGAIGCAVAGCRFPMMLKTCGYDHVVVNGRASRPSYLLISEEGTKLEDASDLWGMDVYETTDRLLKRYEPCSVFPIGPAGENLVRISMTLIDRGGTMGSGGLPALMGSKNLKAIVVIQGKKPTKVARRHELIKLVNQLEERIMKWPGREAVLRGGLRATPEAWWGDPPFRTPLELEREYMNDEGKNEEFELFLRSRKVFACPACPIGDKECLRIRDLKTYSCHLKQEIRAGATDPEEDYYYKVKIQHTADRLGICLHTFHGLAIVIAALQDDGVLTNKDLGVELDGGAPSTIRLMEMIARKEGFGRILADGYPGLVGEFGDAVWRLASHNKGRHALFDPRQSSLGTMEFGELTNPRGAHFQSGGSPAYVPGKTLKDFITHADRMGAPTEAVERVEREGFNPGRYTKYSEDWYSLFSSVGLCNRAFLNRFYSLKLIHGLFSTLTGLPLEARDLMRAAERGWNLTRVHNLRAGFTGKDDAPPEIWFVPGTGEGTQLAPRDYFGESIKREDVDRFLQDYFDERGWDQEGKPTLEKLLDLGLEQVAGDL